MLKSEDPAKYDSWDVKKVAQAFKDAGLSPMEHFIEYGKAEGLSAPAVAPNAGDTPGRPPGSQSLQLTEKIESLYGTDGDDIFSAYSKFSVVGQVNTLQNGDFVDGKEGKDLIHMDEVDGRAVAPKLESIETLSFTSYGGGEINLSNANGIENISVENSVAASTFANARGLVDLSVKNVSGANHVTLGYRADALVGETEQTVNLESLTMAAAGGNLQFNDSENAGKIEKLSINAKGLVNIAAITDPTRGTSDVLDSLEKVVVNAEGETGLGVIDATALTEFDASASEGNVSVDLNKAGANDLTIVGGKGNDTVTMGDTANLNKDDKIDLGEGMDSLVVSTTKATTVAADPLNLKNVENLVTIVDKANSVVNADNLGDSIETVQLVADEDSADAHNVTVNGVANDFHIGLQDRTAENVGLSNNFGTVTVTGKRTSGSDDTVNITVNNLTAGTTARPDVFLAANGLTANGFENINIESLGVANTVNKIGTALNANALETLKISGNAKLEIVGRLDIKAIDASESTAGVEINVGGTNAADGGKQSVTGSKGDDTISVAVADLDKDDVSIAAGDGEDTLFLTDAGNIRLLNALQVENFAKVSGFENLAFKNVGNTVSLADAFLNVFTGDTVNVKATDAAVNGTLTLDASGIVNSSATMNVDASEMAAGDAFDYFISNGTDNYIGSASADTVTVNTGSFLTSNDSIDGGDGVNQLAFVVATPATPTVIQESQLSGVSNFENVTITHAGGSDANRFDMTMSNAFASANANAAGVLNVSLTEGGADEIKLDASAVSGSTNLDVDLATGAQNNGKTTVLLGAGDDTVSMGASNDTVALGAGKDDVIFTATAVNNVLKDFDFGTGKGTGASANVDQLNIAAFNVEGAAGGAVIGRDSVAGSIDQAGVNVVVLDKIGYADSTAAQAALAGISGQNEKVAVFWQDLLGNVHLSVEADAGADSSAAFDNDIATFAKPLSVEGVSAVLDAGDLILA